MSIGPKSDQGEYHCDKTEIMRAEQAGQKDHRQDCDAMLTHRAAMTIMPLCNDARPRPAIGLFSRRNTCRLFGSKAIAHQLTILRDTVVIDVVGGKAFYQALTRKGIELCTRAYRWRTRPKPPPGLIVLLVDF